MGKNSLASNGGMSTKEYGEFSLEVTRKRLLGKRLKVSHPGDYHRTACGICRSVKAVPNTINEFQIKVGSTTYGVTVDKVTLTTIEGTIDTETGRRRIFERVNSPKPR